MNLKNKKIGLALGGGASLGGAHIGVLRALEEKKIKPDIISGTSIGALVGTLFAFGKTSEEIYKMALNVDWFDIAKISLSKFGLLSNEKISTIVKDNLGDVSFKDLKIPVLIVAADIGSGEKVVLKSGNIGEALMASTSIPGVFKPVEIDGKMLVDGGLFENLPVSPLNENGADFIIGSDLRGKRTYKKPENIIELLVNSFDISIYRAKRQFIEKADVLIKMDLSEFSLIRGNNLEKIVEAGYKEAIKNLEKL